MEISSIPFLFYPQVGTHAVNSKKSQTPMDRSITLVLFHPLGRTGAASELRSHGHGGYSPHHHSRLIQASLPPHSASTILPSDPGNHMRSLVLRSSLRLLGQAAESRIAVTSDYRERSRLPDQPCVHLKSLTAPSLLHGIQHAVYR